MQHCLKLLFKDSEVTQQVKVLAAEPKDLEFHPSNCTVEIENPLLQIVL